MADIKTEQTTTQTTSTDNGDTIQQKKTVTETETVKKPAEKTTVIIQEETHTED